MANGEDRPQGKAFIAALLAQAQQDRAQAQPPAQGRAFIEGLLDEARRARAAQEADSQTDQEED